MNTTNKIVRFEQWPPGQVDEIVGLFRGGLYPKEIGPRVGRSPWTVVRLLRQLGEISGKLPRRLQNNRKYHVNESFFDRIDSQEKAYWLGFLFADGYNTEAYRITINLAWSDRLHLNSFKAAIESNHPILYRTVKVKKVNEVARLDVNSAKLCSALARLGMVRAKSEILEWPNWMPEHLARHFIRGYFDGDGWWYVAKTGHTNGHIRFGLCGSKKFIHGLREFLWWNIDIGSPTPFPEPTNGRVDIVVWVGSRQSKQFYDFIYSDASVWLPRKRDKVAKIMESYTEYEQQRDLSSGRFRKKG